MISQQMSIKNILLPYKKSKKCKGNMSVPTCSRDFLSSPGSNTTSPVRYRVTHFTGLALNMNIFML